MSEVARLIKYDELDQLLCLYKQLHPEDPDVQDNKELKSVWDSIYNDPNQYYIVIEVDSKIISSCNLSIIKNLTRNLRAYGLIENVITDLNYRKKGYATKTLNMALEIAKANDCYKVMLLTGSKKDETLRFYEQVGFIKGLKTGFIKNL
ncbi:acetyltransferase (GNAT) family protein [Clostridium homopropionicum DSM 5847]|uniref:Acetyltransferase (GNAT) family protein n=1 Tax=Clostridium homopropionicum DSM 5847 TaxID=1121318 RepID=A0A0L6Z8W2_9CLOT|nr:GNAT family N-acetyltransferase [Clostridium homopropionicum]KOA19208.1 acetyltransferase (GNAT) family protein [Clostridium homopropionicum DSM 5847]SFG17437.1 N-acetylglutamate synthase, GNAT family [Clostridium homopropionicum]